MKAWKWLMAILIIALLAGYYFNGTGWLKETRNTAKLNQEQDNLNSTLALLPLPPADTQDRLAAARASLAAAENATAGETDSNTIVALVLHMAEAAGVKAIPLGTRPWTPEEIAGTKYNVLALTVQATGGFAQIQNFIIELENGGLGTLALTELKVSRETLDPADNVTAEVSVAVYDYAGIIEQAEVLP
jgi:hypothetical protein